MLGFAPLGRTPLAAPPAYGSKLSATLGALTLAASAQARAIGVAALVLDPIAGSSGAAATAISTESSALGGVTVSASAQAGAQGALDQSLRATTTTSAAQAPATGASCAALEAIVASTAGSSHAPAAGVVEGALGLCGVAAMGFAAASGRLQNEAAYLCGPLGAAPLGDALIVKGGLQPLTLQSLGGAPRSAASTQTLGPLATHLVAEGKASGALAMALAPLVGEMHGQHQPAAGALVGSLDALRGDTRGRRRQRCSPAALLMAA